MAITGRSAQAGFWASRPTSTGPARRAARPRRSPRHSRVMRPSTIVSLIRLVPSAEGWVLSSPGLLWYATGGLAYGETKIGSAFTCATCSPSGTANQSSNASVGWTLGGGVEWKFAPAWSVRAEYLYVDLGSQSNTISYNYGTSVSSLTSNLNERDNIVRLGINYMFH